MTRRIRRHRDYQVLLELKNEAFVRPPRDAQRNWLLNRAMWEFGAELEHLDRIAPTFIPGRELSTTLMDDRTYRPLADDEIMEDWQIPVMERMAEIIAASHGDVLEIGFGRGVASSYIQHYGVKNHTIVECNPHVIERCRDWMHRCAGAEIVLIEGKWQDVADQFALYDGILFHAYPLNTTEHVDYVVNGVTFAGHFFATASQHLRKGGSFTYLTNESDSLSRAHQRLLLEHFSHFVCSRLEGLEVPPDSPDMLWQDSIVIIEAVK